MDQTQFEPDRRSPGGEAGQGREGRQSDGNELEPRRYAAAAARQAKATHGSFIGCRPVESAIAKEAMERKEISASMAELTGPD